MTRDAATPPARRAALRAAFALSLTAHAVAVAVVAFGAHGVGFVRPIVRPTPVRPDEVVAISATIRLERRVRARHPAAAHASRPYPLAMKGIAAPLRRGQGIYYPVRSWRAGGLDYYDVAYRFTTANGTLESGRVPWPIHFPPARDPFATRGLARPRDTPLPPPPPDYVPPGTLGRVLRSYFPHLVFSDTD